MDFAKDKRAIFKASPKAIKNSKQNLFCLLLKNVLNSIEFPFSAHLQNNLQNKRKGSDNSLF